MKILYWSELFWPYIGGVEVLSAELLPELRDRGCDIIVVTSHDHLHLPDEAEYKRIKVYRFAFRRAIVSGNIAQLVRVRQEIAKLKQIFAPDLIHVNSVSPSVLFHLQTSNASPAPTLVTMQQEILPSEGGGDDTLIGKALRSATWVSCVSSAVLDQALHWVPELKSRSSIIYNALQMKDIPVPLPQKPPRLLCLGRLVPAKGFDLVVEAMAKLAARFPDVRLTIAGGGPLQADLQRQVESLGLTEKVEFLGWVEPQKVASIINEATIVLMPSRREGLPIVAVQAAVMSRPLVATRVSGLAELVVDGETGILIDVNDSAGLAKAVGCLLEQPELATRMGEAARIRVQKQFNWQTCVTEYYSLYQKLITYKEESNASSGFSSERM